MAPGIGSQYNTDIVTADGVVGTSGADTILFGITVKGGSATTLADVTEGTDGTGTAKLDIIAPINNTITMNFGPNGIFFAGGIHLDITTTAGSVTFIYNQ